MKHREFFIVFSCFWCISAYAFAQDEGGEAGASEDKGESAAAEGATDESGEGKDLPAPVEAPSDTPEDAAGPAQPEEESKPEPTFKMSDFSIEKILKALKALKGKIEQSEKRMNDIVSVVLSSADTKGSRIVLIHRSEMSPDFKLVQATVSLDGAPIYKKSDDDGIMFDKEVEIYDGAILPGKHKLSVTLIYRGHGYGILSYLSKYKFKVRSTHSFAVKEGKGIQLKIVSFEKGDTGTKLEDRPAIKYGEKKIGME